MLRDIPEGFEVLLRTVRVFYLNFSWKPRKSFENLPTIPAINLKAELSEKFSVVDNLYAVAKEPIKKINTPWPKYGRFILREIIRKHLLMCHLAYVLNDYKFLILVRLFYITQGVPIINQAI